MQLFSYKLFEVAKRWFQGYDQVAVSNTGFVAVRVEVDQVANSYGWDRSRQVYRSLGVFTKWVVF